MNRALIILSVVWVAVLSSGLCLVGVLEHCCDNSLHGATCGHEEDCFSDPCNNVLLRPGTSAGHSSAQLTGIASATLFPSTETQLIDSSSRPRPSRRLNLPRPPSDLPLLL